jgi:hypothetical protein
MSELSTLAIVLLVLVGICGLLVGYAIGLVISLSPRTQAPLVGGAVGATFLFSLVAWLISIYFHKEEQGVIAARAFFGALVPGLLFGYLRGKALE